MSFLYNYILFQSDKDKEKKENKEKSEDGEREEKDETTKDSVSKLGGVGLKTDQYAKQLAAMKVLCLFFIM